MRKKLFIQFILIATVLCFGGTLLAQVSLQAKVDYMEKLKQEAEILESQGYYDDSIEKSREVQRLSEEIDGIIAVLKKWYLLQRNIAVAKQVGADKVAKEEFDKAIEFYQSAEQAFVDDDLEQAEMDIDEGLYYIDLAIQKAQNALSQSVEVKKDNDIPHNVELTQVDGEYVVRLIPEKRDCLWRIAEYDFVYGNPWQWKRIYNANRDIIDNPDLIYPGQKLVIPPLPYEPDLELDLE